MPSRSARSRPPALDTSPLPSGPAAPTPDTAELPEGRYALQHPLRRGDLATEYLALDTVLNRPVTVKLYHADLCRDPRLMRRLLQAERRVARLFHPGLVTIYDVDASAGGCFVVVEYLGGGSLRDLLEAGGWPSAVEVARIVAQVAEALQLLHDERIVHGDVKLDTVLLDEAGNAKLTDFSLDRLGAVDIGEPPEQDGRPRRAGRARPNARDDLRALGRVAYALLLGRDPFEGASDHDLGGEEAAAALAAQRANAPAGLRQVVARLLAPEREGGFASAAELLQALAQVQLAATAPTVAARRPAAGPASRAPEPPASPAPASPTGRTAAEASRPRVRTFRVGGSQAVPLAPREVADSPRSKAAPRLMEDEGSLGESRSLGARPSRSRPAPRVPLSCLNLLQRVWPYQTPNAFGGLGLLRNMLTGTLLPTRAAAAARALRQRHPRALPLLAGAALVGLLALALTLPRLLDPPRPVSVPQLAGQPLEVARDAARRAGLALETVEERSDIVSKGVVIRQEPPAGAMLPSDRPVRAVVSAGPPPVRVPDLSQRRLDDARRDLAAAGLALSKVEEREVPRGQWGAIVSQSARPGSTLERGASVDVVVGVPPWTSVPKLADRALGEAEAELEQRGLRLGQVRLEPRAGKRAGTVVAQEPPPDARLRQGEGVAVTIAVPAGSKP